ncbi:MAG: sigma-70 family RNA polymerase sigma factor [Pseudomonadota bacterium]
MAKDKEAFLVELAQRYGPSLERFLARKLDNPADAAEIAQETFLRLHRLDHPDELDNARAFLFQVASNLAVDQLRRRQLHYRFLRTESREPGDDGSLEQLSDVASPEQILSGREKLDRIYQAIDRLPEKCRQAFLMHRSKGLSYSDIARELGVSVSSVEKYVLEALKACRAELADYYAENDGICDNSRGGKT